MANKLNIQPNWTLSFESFCVTIVERLLYHTILEIMCYHKLAYFNQIKLHSTVFQNCMAPLLTLYLVGSAKINIWDLSEN